MTDIAKEKLRAYGIAPPGQHCAKGREAGETCCALCAVPPSQNRRYLARTAAPAIPSNPRILAPRRARRSTNAWIAREPFDYFKPY